MYRTIMVPLDGSELAERALPYAVPLARSSGAKLLLLRAVSAHTLPGVDPGPEQLRVVEEAEGYLKCLEAGLDPAIAVETAVFYGDPAEGIVDEIGLRRADLVVMGTHGRSGLGRWVYGSVAEAVLRQSPVPVLLVQSWSEAPPAGPFAPRPRILVPLDGSGFAEEALPLAQTIAQAVQGQLILIEAVPHPTDTQLANRGQLVSYGQAEMSAQRLETEARGGSFGYIRPSFIEAEPRGTTVAYLDQTLDGRRHRANDYLHAVAKRLAEGEAQGNSVAPEVLVQVGDPTASIVAASQQANADLIVMATHGRTGLARLMMGSVAGGVVRSATVPLLLVRPAALC